MRYRFITLISLLLVLTVGCATVPVDLQLVSASPEQTKISSTADCRIDQAPQAISVRSDRFAALNPNQFTLLNWNIYKGQRENWQADFEQFIQHADILVLQEALLREPLVSALHQQALYWSMNYAFRYQGNETGVLTAARIKPRSTCGLRTTEPLIRVPKTILVQRYPMAGQQNDLLVANLHGINFTLGTEAYKRQLDSLRKILSQHTGPVILAGDFNNWSEERTAIVNHMAKALNLNNLPYDNHNRTRVFGHAIDHIYYRGLEAIAHKTLEVTSSDHNPISVTFRLKTPTLARYKR